jgi:hypothetical protein
LSTATTGRETQPVNRRIANLVKLASFLRTGLFVWLALIAFTVKASIPAGYMAAAGGGVVACGDLIADAPGKPKPAKPEQPCAFAGLAAMALDAPPEGVALLVPQASLHVADAPLPRAERPQLNPAAPPPARGPPPLNA